jgi:2-dehydropantoate 2-reductase
MPDAAGFAFVGAGSLGLTLAAALAAAGIEATLLGRPDSSAALLAAGEIAVSGALSVRAPVAPAPAPAGVVGVTADPASLPDVVGTLFVTKGHQLEAAVGELAARRAGSLRRPVSGWVAGMQNGVVKDDVLAAAYGDGRVLAAATVLGARRAGAGEVMVSGLGTTYFGERAGPAGARVLEARDAFRAAGIPTEAVDDAASLLWAKLANAVGIFAVSALSGLPTGELFARPGLVRAYRLLLGEVDAVARAEGVEIRDHPDLPMRSYLDTDPDELAARLSARTAAARAATGGASPSYSSMLQDLMAGRPTEREQIFGDLVRRGRRHGVPTPRAELARDLIDGLESGRSPGTGPG